MNDPGAECVSFYRRIMDHFHYGRHTDVRVICNDRRVFLCHRLVLVVASKYLDRMLSEKLHRSSPTHVDLPLELSGDTFASILPYMYSGRVNNITDENFHHVLIAGDTLQMETVQSACLRYLSVKGIPRQSAVNIFKHACRPDSRTLLLATASRFFLGKKNYLNLRNVPTAAHSNALLPYYRPNNRMADEIMRRTIRELMVLWNLDAEGVVERVRSKFIKNVNLRRFIKCSGQNDAARYSAKEITIYRAPQRLREGTAGEASGLRNNLMPRALHLYTQSQLSAKKIVTSDRAPHRPREGTAGEASRMSSNLMPHALHVFTQSQLSPLRLSILDIEDGVCTSRALNLPSGIRRLHGLRCTVVDSNIFWLLSYPVDELPFGEDYSIEFRVSRFPDGLSSSLRLPEPTTILDQNSSLLLCSDGWSTIFVGKEGFNGIYRYNCLVNRWSRLTLGDDDFFVHAMAWHESQLYLVGGGGPYYPINCIRSYDPRSGRYEHVMDYTHPNIASFECFGHRGHLYLASTSSGSSEISMLDLVTRKKTQVLPVPAEFGVVYHECRFASFQNALWAFFCNPFLRVRAGMLDSNSVTIQNVPVQEPVASYPHNLLDVVVYETQWKR